MISTRFHFTIGQLRYLCHLHLSWHSISSDGNLHVCILFGPFVRQRQSVRTVNEDRISAPRLVFTFDTKAYRSATRMGFWKGKFLSKLQGWKQLFKGPAADTHTLNMLYTFCTYLKPLWHMQTRGNGTLEIYPTGNFFPFRKLDHIHANILVLLHHRNTIPEPHYSGNASEQLRAPRPYLNERGERSE